MAGKVSRHTRGAWRDGIGKRLRWNGTAKFPGFVDVDLFMLELSGD